MKFTSFRMGVIQVSINMRLGCPTMLPAKITGAVAFKSVLTTLPRQNYVIRITEEFMNYLGTRIFFKTNIIQFLLNRNYLVIECLRLFNCLIN